MRELKSVLLAAALSGCASTPVSQGGAAEIMLAGNETIRIRWNPQFTNERAMRSKAIAFCGGRDVDLLESSTATEASGGLQANTWRCKAFPGSGSGM
jgi:hypothetical protein